MVFREEQQQPVFMAIDALDFPELHDESIPYMAFLKNCTRLLGAAGVRDFNMQVSSLLHPSCELDCMPLSVVALAWHAFSAFLQRPS